MTMTVLDNIRKIVAIAGKGLTILSKSRELIIDINSLKFVAFLFSKIENILKFVVYLLKWSFYWNELKC